MEADTQEIKNTPVNDQPVSGQSSKSLISCIIGAIVLGLGIDYFGKMALGYEGAVVAAIGSWFAGAVLCLTNITHTVQYGSWHYWFLALGIWCLYSVCQYYREAGSPHAGFNPIPILAIFFSMVVNTAIPTQDLTFGKLIEFSLLLAAALSVVEGLAENRALQNQAFAYREAFGRAIGIALVAGGVLVGYSIYKNIEEGAYPEVSATLTQKYGAALTRLNFAEIKPIGSSYLATSNVDGVIGNRYIKQPKACEILEPVSIEGTASICFISIERHDDRIVVTSPRANMPGISAAEVDKRVLAIASAYLDRLLEVAHAPAATH